MLQNDLSHFCDSLRVGREVDGALRIACAVRVPLVPIAAGTGHTVMHWAFDVHANNSSLGCKLSTYCFIPMTAESCRVTNQNRSIKNTVPE